MSDERTKKNGFVCTILGLLIGSSAYAGLTLERQDPGIDRAQSPFVTGDIDGDEDLDVIVAVGPHDVVALLNDGYGQLRRGAAWSESTWDTREIREDLLLADVDGDKDLDLIMVVVGGEHVIVRRNDGTGGFGAPERHPVSRHLVAGPEAGDIDGDGDIDLLVFYGDQLDILMNDGTGSFAAPMVRNIPSIMPPLPGVNSIALSDLDGDCDLDIGAFKRGDLIILTNDGTGVFTAGEPMAIGFVPNSIWPADVDGDLDVDLVAVGMHVPDDGDIQTMARVLRNAGNGTFEIGDDIVGPESFHSAIGDVSGDGRPDLCMSSLAGALHIWIGRGNGTFADHIMIDAGFAFNDLPTWCDLDGDGRDDLIGTASGSSGKMLGVLLTREPGNGPASWTAEELANMTTPDLRAELAHVAKERMKARRNQDWETEAQFERDYELLIVEIRKRHRAGS